VVLEAAGEDANSVSVECGGDGIPVTRFDLAAAESDFHGAGLSTGADSIQPLDFTSFVRVSRTA
jgi:hypothetical protein